MSREEIQKLFKDNPIKVIKYGDIEIPVEWLKQTTVNINGDDYIKLQKQNQQLKESLKDEEQQRIKIAKERDELHKECLNHIEQKKQLKEVIEEVRIYIEDNSNQMSEDATYDLLQILDKGESNE